RGFAGADGRRARPLAHLCQTARFGQRLPDDVQHQRIHVRSLKRSSTMGSWHLPTVGQCSRREMLARWGGGFGALALAHLLGREAFLAGDNAEREELNGGLHHRAKVRRVVQLFMNGGASPMDTFDYKPRLAKLNGQIFDPGGGAKVESVTGSPGFKVLKTPF